MVNRSSEKQKSLARDKERWRAFDYSEGSEDAEIDARQTEMMKAFAIPGQMSLVTNFGACHRFFSEVGAQHVNDNYTLACKLMRNARNSQQEDNTAVSSYYIILLCI